MKNISDTMSKFLEAASVGDVRTLDSLFEGPASQRHQQSDGKNALHIAAFHGQTIAVRWMLQNNFDVDCRTKKQATPFHLACFAGHVDTAQELLQQGADKDGIDTVGRTALHFATLKGHIPIMEWLVQTCGFQIDITTKQGMTPMHFAALGGQKEAAIWLVQHNASTQIKTVDFLYPIHYAASQGHISMLEWLIERDPELVSQGDQRGRTPLHIAAVNAHAGAVMYLLSETSAKCDVADAQGLTPVKVVAASLKQVSSASKNSSEYVPGEQDKMASYKLIQRYFAAAMSEPNPPKIVHISQAGKSSVRIVWQSAARLQCQPSIEAYSVSFSKEWSIGSGNEIDIPLREVSSEKVGPGTPYSPKHSFRTPNRSSGLQQTEAASDTKDTSDTASELDSLFFVSPQKQEKPRRGSKSSIKSSSSSTCTTSTAMQLSTVVAGINPGINYTVKLRSRNRNGWSNWSNKVELHMDEQYNEMRTPVRPTFTDMARSANPNPSSNPNRPSAKNEVPVPKSPVTLHQTISHVTVATSQLEKDLLTAAEKGDVDTMDLLISQGAEAHTIDENGRLILHLAARNGSLEAVKWCLGRHLNPIDATDKLGATPLLLAVVKGHLHAVCELAQQGASVDASDYNGYSCLHYAVIKRQILAFRWLLEVGANPNVNTRTGQPIEHFIEAIHDDEDIYMNTSMTKGTTVRQILHSLLTNARRPPSCPSSPICIDTSRFSILVAAPKLELVQNQIGLSPVLQVEVQYSRRFSLNPFWETVSDSIHVQPEALCHTYLDKFMTETIDTLQQQTQSLDGIDTMENKMDPKTNMKNITLSSATISIADSQKLQSGMYGCLLCPDLSVNTGYVFRMRLRNINGWGPYSVKSAEMTTKSSNDRHQINQARSLDELNSVLANISQTRGTEPNENKDLLPKTKETFITVSEIQNNTEVLKLRQELVQTVQERSKQKFELDTTTTLLELAYDCFDSSHPDVLSSLFTPYVTTFLTALQQDSVECIAYLLGGQVNNDGFVQFTQEMGIAFYLLCQSYKNHNENESNLFMKSLLQGRSNTCVLLLLIISPIRTVLHDRLVQRDTCTFAQDILMNLTDEQKEQFGRFLMSTRKAAASKTSSKTTDQMTSTNVDFPGFPLFGFICLADNTELIKCLYNCIEFSSSMSDYYPVFLAAFGCKHQLAEILPIILQSDKIDAASLLSIKDSTQKNVFHFAAAAGNIHSLSCLDSFCVDTDDKISALSATDQNKWMPLHFAIATSHVNCVRWILQQYIETGIILDHDTIEDVMILATLHADASIVPLLEGYISSPAAPLVCIETDTESTAWILKISCINEDTSQMVYWPGDTTEIMILPCTELQSESLPSKFPLHEGNIVSIDFVNSKNDRCVALSCHMPSDTKELSIQIQPDQATEHLLLDVSNWIVRVRLRGQTGVSRWSLARFV